MIGELGAGGGGGRGRGRRGGGSTCDGMYQPTHLGVAQHSADDTGFIL